MLPQHLADYTSSCTHLCCLQTSPWRSLCGNVHSSSVQSSELSQKVVGRTLVLGCLALPALLDLRTLLNLQSSVASPPEKQPKMSMALCPCVLRSILAVQEDLRNSPPTQVCLVHGRERAWLFVSRYLRGSFLRPQHRPRVSPQTLIYIRRGKRRDSIII